MRVPHRILSDHPGRGSASGIGVHLRLLRVIATCPRPGQGGSASMNLQPRRPPGRADEPFRHLIDEYKHQTQTVTCTCGWQGSSASPDGRTSDWKDHLAATRTSASGPVTKTSATAPKAVPVVR